MQAGLEPEIMIKAISGSGTSRMFGVRGPRSADGGCKIWWSHREGGHASNDIKIISDFANKLNCPTYLLSAAAQLYTVAFASGYSKNDTTSVVPC